MTYHEYFVGGPLDGQTRGVGLPKVSMVEAYEYVDLMASPPSGSMDSPYTQVPFITWQYQRMHIAMGTKVLSYWADPKMMPEAQIRARLWEIILEPHKFIPDVPTERRTS